MTLSIPGYVASFESIMWTLVMGAALALIWVGAARAESRGSARFAIGGLLSAILIGWVVLAQRLGAENIFLASTDRQPQSVALPLALLVPLAVAAAGIWASRRIMSLVSAIPIWSLVAIQFYRVAGVIFVILWAAGDLPWQFALPAGLGDIATGALAIWVAALLARKAEGASRAAYSWCVFGIADLIVALTMGMITSPGPFHLLAHSDPNRFVSAYPLVMIPTFGVPLALILHGIVLWRLKETFPEGSAADGALIAQSN